MLAELCRDDIKIAVHSSDKSLLEAVQDGIETARCLREFLPKVSVSFLTTSRKHAIDAFELDALHYFVKPVTLEKIRILLDRFLARDLQASQLSPILTLICGQEKHRFPVNQIRYIISRDRSIMLYLPKQKRIYWLSCLLRQAIERLAENPDFLQISPTCMINLNAVLYIGRENCHMKDGTCLSISRRERQTVQNCYQTWRKAPSFRYGDKGHTLFPVLGTTGIAFVFVEWYNIFMECKNNHHVDKLIGCVYRWRHSFVRHEAVH